MAALTYFTARYNLNAVVADLPASQEPADTDPQKVGIYAGVTITPFVSRTDTAALRAEDGWKMIKAPTLDTPGAVVLAAFPARIEYGVLSLFADQPDVRLTAETDVLGLPANMGLFYRFDFDHVKYAGADQTLPSITIRAKTADVVADLVTEPWV